MLSFSAYIAWKSDYQFPAGHRRSLRTTSPYRLQRQPVRRDRSNFLPPRRLYGCPLLDFWDESVAKEESVKRQYLGNGVYMTYEFFAKHQNCDDFLEGLNWLGLYANVNVDYSPTGSSLSTNGWTLPMKINQPTPGWNTLEQMCIAQFPVNSIFTLTALL